MRKIKFISMSSRNISLFLNKNCNSCNNSKILMMKKTNCQQMKPKSSLLLKNLIRDRTRNAIVTNKNLIQMMMIFSAAVKKIIIISWYNRKININKIFKSKSHLIAISNILEIKIYIRITLMKESIKTTKILVFYLLFSDI